MTEMYLLIKIKNSNVPQPQEVRLDVPETLKTVILSGQGSGREYVANNLLKQYAPDLEKIVEQLVNNKCILEFSFHIINNNRTKTHIVPNANLESVMSKIKIKGIIEEKIKRIARESSACPPFNLEGSDELVHEINILEDTFFEINILDEELENEENQMDEAQKPSKNDVAEKQTEYTSNNSTKQAEQEADSKDSLDNDIVFQEENKETKQPNKSLPKIIVRQKALELAKKHAVDEKDMETGGVMVGRFIPDDKGVVSVVVTGIVRGMHTIRRVASLTFTPETWAQVNYWIDNDPIYSDDKTWTIVGWYHTHPSFGIFLSSYDLSIHKPHFKRPEHVALVIDPIRQQEGFFCWNLPQTEVLGHEFKVLKDDEVLKYMKGLLAKDIKELPVPEIHEPKQNKET